MSRPLVSVILPVYNGASTLPETLESIFAQTYSPIEVIAVDDCSTDSSADLLVSCKDRLKLIRRETNSGVCDQARCEAIRAARGKYCAFIDQDDLWTPNKLEKQVAFMEAHPDIPLSHTYMRVIDENGSMMEIRHDGKIPPTGPCARELLKHCFITISSVLVRPEVWLAAQARHGTRFANTDIETFLWILKDYPVGFGFLPEVLGSYRRWSQSMSRQNWRWAPEDVNELDRVYETGCWRGLVSRKETRRLIGEAYAKNAEHHRHAGWPGRSLFFVRRGLRYAPLSAGLYASGVKATASGLMGKGFAQEERG